MLDTQGNFPAIRLIQKNEKATSRNNAVLKYNVVPASMKDRDVGIPSKSILRGVVVALVLQFVLLPLIGFCVVRAFDLPRIEGIMLMVVVSSPGGAYSGWWCSLFNADLALSVAATTFSTVISVAMLPLNLLIYLSASYGTSPLSDLRWDLLVLSLCVQAVAVFSGTLVSCMLSKRAAAGQAQAIRADWVRMNLNKLGNLAGLCLIIFSIVFSSADEPIWDKEAKFYAATATPCVVALFLSMAITRLPCLRLAPPERVAVTIECLYQNTGIAVSIALSVFSGRDASRAAGSPLYYGVCQTVTIPLYVIAAWQLDCTYAPRTDPIWRVVKDSYQHRATGAGAASHPATNEVTPADHSFR